MLQEIFDIFHENNIGDGYGYHDKPHIGTFCEDPSAYPEEWRGCDDAGNLDPVNCFGDSDTGLGNSGGTGDAIAASVLFPAGITLFGRWTEVDLASGVVVLYMAR